MLADPQSLKGARANVARQKVRKTLPDVANAVAMVGDLVMILLGLFLGYCIRFRSGWIPQEIPWWTNTTAHIPLAS